MLWGAFFALVVLVGVGLALTVTVLQVAKQQESRAIHESQPLIDAVHNMEVATMTILAAARGDQLTGKTEFLQQYDDAVREFEKASAAAEQVARGQDVALIRAFEQEFRDIKSHTDRENEYTKAKNFDLATGEATAAAAIRRSAKDYDGMITDAHRRAQSLDIERMAGTRLGLTLLMVLVSIAIILIAGFALGSVERRLRSSITRQVERTEAMIAGMADSVMLVDSDGRTVFINPAGQRLLDRSVTGVPIYKHAETYGFRDSDGRPVDARELPAAQALSTGRAVQDVTMTIRRDDGAEIAISMSATPLHEEGRISGVIVTFRDITERRQLERDMQLQAERAQILADAGAFFSSNIDPVWVTQAIAERVAEVLGDWAAIILRSEDSKELRVASIYHRDMTSLGLAWSYIYRQNLIVGEGIIGQVVSTGYPSLMQNVGTTPAVVPGAKDAGPYHPSSMKLASLLVLPLRTRREMLGALVIAANDPERQMTDENLPLAEVLAERASLAIENAKLYTEQVEARRKVEDLSRLKDEFLSIASHELRTPVTSIKGYSQLAKTLIRENDLATAEEYLDIAIDQIDRMSRLILELLDVSRIETGRLEIRREPIRWPAFVRDVVQRHHTAVSDRRFHLNVAADAVTINGDRDRLEQVLGNLLENAVKYSPDGSDITVEVEEKGDSVVTSICDRGIGIPTDELGQVFERFHRGRQVSSTNYGGLGLGLYITKQIVERHGGTIWVESREGQGTTFHFSLPVAEVQSGVGVVPSVARELGR